MAVESPLVISNLFIPVNYKLAIDIVPSKPNFTGELEIDLISNANHISEEEEVFKLKFNSANIIVTSAEFVSGDERQKVDVKYERALETAIFSTSNKDFQDLSEFKIVLKYVAKISSIKTYQDITAGVFKTNYLNGLTGKADNHIISTHCQPKYARLIFPCVDELTSKPTFELSIKTDIKYTCISNTAIKDTTIVDDVKKIVHFQKTPPMTPSIFGFVVGDLEHVQQTVKLQDKEIPIRVYTPIGELENATYPLNVAALALPELETMIHHPYPLEKLDFVALPFLSDSAMEDWGLIQVQQSFLLVEPELINKKDAEGQIRNLREVIVHELVHQWVGNLITFDDWHHLWLNEAFATFLAYAVLIKLNLNAKDKLIWEEKYASDFQNMMDNDSLHTADPIFVKHAIEVKSTQDALDQNSYYKGIPLLRMLGNLFNDKSNDDFDNFLKIIGEFLQHNKFKVFKPVDLWTFITNSSLNTNKFDIATLMHSWTRTAGHPILKVTVNSQGKINVTQHRYIYGVKAEDEGEAFEDIPYHIPITCKLSNGTIARQLLTDRKKDLDISPDFLLSINANYSNLAKVQYPQQVFANISSGIKSNAYTALDLISIANDLNKILGQPYQEESDIIGLFEIVEAYLSSTTVLEYQSLDMFLNMIQNVSSSIELVNNDSNMKLINNVNQKVGNIISALKDKMLWDAKEIDYSKCSNFELRSRNSVLILGNKLKPQEFQPIIKLLYKNLIHGPKQTVPKELLNSVLAGTVSYSNQKEYKEILALAKAPTLTINNIIKDGSSDSDIRGVLQTSAVLALGYVSQPDLITKTLNFVMTNIDSKLIELALIGLQLQPHLKQQLWDWYSLHYNSWCLKTFREGSVYAKQMKATLTNISKIIFSIMVNNVKSTKKLNAFVNDKMSSSLYQKFNLQEILDAVKLENEEKVKLNEHNNAILIWLNSH